MTTIITRLYADAETAGAVAAALAKGGMRKADIDVLAADAAAPVAERMQAAQVDAAAAAAYAPKLEAGAVLVVARAPVTPFGAALRAMETVDGFPSIDAGVANQNRYVRIRPKFAKSRSILSDHPRFLTEDFTAVARRRRRDFKGTFGWPLLSKPKPRTSAMAGGGFMSTRFIPTPLLSEPRERTSAVGRSGTPLSRMLGLKLLVRR